MRFRNLITATLVAISTLALAPRADAALMVAGTINGNNFCVTDNNAACGFGIQINDTNAAIGTLSYGQVPLNLFGIEITGSVQTSVFGPPQNVLNTGSTLIRNLTGGVANIQLAVSDTGYTAPSTLAFASGTATWENAVNSTITMTWFNDPANGQGALTSFLPQPGNAIFTCSDVVSFVADGTNCVSGPIGVNDPNPYSMTLYTQMSLAAGASVVNRGQTEIKLVDEVVPEPMTMSLMGLGLFGAMFARRRR